MSTIEKSSEIVREVYQSRRVLLEQLDARGFDTTEHEAFSITDIYHMVKAGQMNMSLSTSAGEKVEVRYHIEKGLRGDTVNAVAEELFEYEQKLDKETDSIIFVVRSEPNDTLIKAIEQLWNEKRIYVCAVYLKRLQFNVLRHAKVPVHEALGPVEAAEFLDRFSIDAPEKKLPTISRFDPVAMAIGLRPGQICRITRHSPTSISALYYRICV
jgi:DNA-directed RNA polymerase subunit H (RpoH/RPB5)